jgi:hypothetical protein
MTFDQQLEALKPHCRLRRALFTENGTRAWEITFANGRFHLYKLNEYGHLWAGTFFSFESAYDPIRCETRIGDFRISDKLLAELGGL